MLSQLLLLFNFNFSFSLLFHFLVFVFLSLFPEGLRKAEEAEEARDYFFSVGSMFVSKALRKAEEAEEAPDCFFRITVFVVRTLVSWKKRKKQKNLLQHSTSQSAIL